ncbi:unnamed protein product, partial [Ascophyllum nodosum]
MADILRDPDGTRRAIAPTLAQIPLAATTDVAVTGVGREKTEIALQIPHPPLGRPRLNNFLLPLSQDSSKSRFLQYIIRPQVTKTKQMVRDAFARAEADERSGQPGR